MGMSVCVWHYILMIRLFYSIYLESVNFLTRSKYLLTEQLTDSQP